MSLEDKSLQELVNELIDGLKQDGVSEDVIRLALYKVLTDERVFDADSLKSLLKEEINARAEFREKWNKMDVKEKLNHLRAFCIGVGVLHRIDSKRIDRLYEGLRQAGELY